MLVNLESRYGIWSLDFVLFAYDKVAITHLRVNNDLFMSILYLACLPSVPVSPILSDPAKSTSYNLLIRTLWGLILSKDSTLTVNILCDLEEDIFSLWEAVILFLRPILKYFITYSGDLHSKMNKFYTVNWSFLDHLSLSPDWLVLAILTGLSKSYIL